MDIVEYKCPNCSADLKFSPQTQRLTCEYCGGSFTMEEIKKLFEKNESALDQGAAAQQTQQEAQGSGEFEQNTKMYTCSSCGAEVMADSQQTALFCYYCHNPVILSGKMTGNYRPQKVIGFKIARDQAVEGFKKWCFKSFVPNDFKTQQQLEKITGLYVPFWLADCTVDINYQGNAKQIRSWYSGNYEYTETKSFSLKRWGSVVANNVPADGSKRIDDELMESIEPFNYSDMKDFSMSYLSGFYAEKYDMDKDAMFPRIKERLTGVCKSHIHNTLNGYTATSTVNESYDFSRADMKYVMLPVWFMSYKYKDKVYEFAMNGQTGKFVGNLPTDWGKFWRTALLFTAGAGALIYGIAWLLQLL